MNKIYLLILSSVLVVSFTGHQAQAATIGDTVIGVLTKIPGSPYPTGTLNLLAADGTNLSTSSLIAYREPDQRIMGDVHSNTGLEYLNYYSYYYSYQTGQLYGAIVITDQSANVLDYFQPLSTASAQSAVIAVGELSSLYDGQEIAVCRSSTTLPGVKIYNYSETAGAVLISSFHPFGDNNKTIRGCASITLGDVDGDGDGDQDIIVMSNNSKKTLRAFTVDGTLIAQIAANTIDTSIDSAQLQVGDLDGDGVDSVVLHSSNSSDLLYDVTMSTEPTYTTITLDDATGQKSIKDYAVGDIDNDRVDEIVTLLSGRKGKIEIISAGSVITTMQTDPSAQYKRERNIYLGAFSY